jgi:nucleoid-associated protein EbfC
MKLNIQDILKQAQKVQQEMEQAKSEISKKIVTSDSGGGMVQVTITGDCNVLKIKLADEIVNLNEKEMLEDLIVAAFNKAITEAQELASDEMNRLSKFMPNMPSFDFGE